MEKLALEDFPFKTFDKIRYGDTDRQGHVNNAVFSTYLETGRVDALHHPDVHLLTEETSFVIVSLKLDYLNEICWPGQVDIGTGIVKIGNSSITFFQKIFQDGKCVAKGQTVIVHVDNTSGRSKPLSEQAKKMLSEWVLKDTEELK